MPGQRPYYEFEHDGEKKTIEADTWSMTGDEVVFSKWVIDGPKRREEEIARFAGVDYRSINRVIP
ncbi:MAG: hypothetical protein AB1673_05460 [Actinomycetota bacterium]